MKMKKVPFIVSVLALAAGLSSCKKEKVVAPDQDSETASALEATWAVFAVTDLEQMCAYMGEDVLQNHIYKQDLSVPGSGTVVTTRDLVSSTMNMSFNRSYCADGRFRNSGSVFMDYAYSNVDWVKPYYDKAGITRDYKPRFYHEYGFLGRLTLNDYKVEGWTIKTDSNGLAFTSAVTYNDMKETDFDPKTQPLKWNYSGSFVLYHPDTTTPRKHIKISVDLVKTLTNSTAVKVFSATTTKKDIAVTWSLGIVSYSGRVTGKTLSGESFTMEINPSAPLIRDFTCFPDKVGNVTVAASGTLTPYTQEFHPFTSGVASFTTQVGGKDVYPRKIYFGNEGNVALIPQCDNTGEVFIKGISHKVNFWK